MKLHDGYYFDFLQSKSLSPVNRKTLQDMFAQAEKTRGKGNPATTVRVNYDQLLEAMFVLQIPISVEIIEEVAGEKHRSKFSFEEDDIVYLLNSCVCKTEFLPEQTDKYLLLRHQRAQIALETLRSNFVRYLKEEASKYSNSGLQIN